LRVISCHFLGQRTVTFLGMVLCCLPPYLGCRKSLGRSATIKFVALACTNARGSRKTLKGQHKPLR
jgi:hypothetical protein